MAGQGCINEGSDHRIFGRWTCKLEQIFSFHASKEPFSILLAFPPFVAINIPWTKGRYLMLRAGFRYDKNWPGYIFPEMTIKVTDHTIFY